MQSGGKTARRRGWGGEEEEDKLLVRSEASTPTEAYNSISNGFRIKVSDRARNTTS